MTVLARVAKCSPPCATLKPLPRFSALFRDGGRTLPFRASTWLGGLACCAALAVMPLSAASQGLQVSYGARGVQTLAFNGVTLADVNANPGDAFHIWHMKSTDLHGNVVNTGQYGWGENNNGTQWDAGSKTETYRFQWGSIQTQFVQSGNTLNVVVTETNNAGSGVVFDGAEVDALTMRFPQEPKQFFGYSQYAITTTGPGVSVADFASGVVTSVVPDESVPMYGGWKSLGGGAYVPLMATTAPDGLATFLPRVDRGVQPGETFTYTVSLRFTPEGTPADANDAYASFAKTYPSQMTWADHRILGTAYLASSPQNATDITRPGGFPTNPRRWFNDAGVDVTTAAGLKAFQNRMLQVAQANVTNARAMNGQGVVTWDIEGEQYPMDTSYVCSPDQIAAVAPEMESTVLDAASAYYGQKLDDAYFKTMTSAGLKVGVCVRPQQFVLAGNGTASQNFLQGNAAVIANLENKIKFANQRWGVTVFYVDSTVDANGGTLDPAIFQQLITDMPGFLFIPEESTPRYYAYSAPFYSFLFHTNLGTPASVYQYYPNAFGANLVNDVSAGTLSQYQTQLTATVGKGDILMGIADFWQANDPTLVQIYEAAGKASLPPVQVTPAVQWATPATIVYGTALGSAQLNAVASAAGTYAYSPAAGTVLKAGTQPLLVTFTPTDTKDYTTATATVNLLVAQATPVVTWAAPAAVVQGTALGAAQLNATASVPGTFAYSPAAGTVLAAGTSTLRVTFTPADAVDYRAASASVALTVKPVVQATPAVTWHRPAAITVGTALSAKQLNATVNVPGTFSYSPAGGTVLPVGTSTLRVTFTPADTVKYRAVSASVSLTVKPVVQATPAVTWNRPPAITYGTALSTEQLNATGSVPGTFSYSPAAGTMLAAGTQILTVTFTPSDAVAFKTVSKSVLLTVKLSKQARR